MTHAKPAIFTTCVLAFLLSTAPGRARAESSDEASVPSQPAACERTPGRSEGSVTIEGVPRRYVTWVGPKAARPDTKPPLVFLWHGFGGSPDGISAALPPEQLWPEAIVVAPQGLNRRFPNLGRERHAGWQTRLGELRDRDLRFFDALLDELRRDLCIDDSRVYSTGFSNGGYFSNLLGCTRANAVAAIAPVSSGSPPAPKTCSVAVPVLITHGLRDRVVRYRFGQESYNRWTRHNQCSEAPSPTPEGCVDAGGCAATTRMCTFSGGHRWPKDASEKIVRFFQRHARGADTEDAPASPETAP